MFVAPSCICCYNNSTNYVLMPSVFVPIGDPKVILSNILYYNSSKIRRYELKPNSSPRCFLVPTKRV